MLSSKLISLVDNKSEDKSLETIQDDFPEEDLKTKNDKCRSFS